MMIASTEISSAGVQRRLDRLPWRRIADTVRTLGMITISAAVGGWAVSIRDHAAQLPYLERTTAAHEAETKVLGANPVALVKCERRRAAIAEKNAVATVKAAETANVPLPSLVALPPLCPPVPAPPAKK